MLDLTNDNLKLANLCNDDIGSLIHANLPVGPMSSTSSTGSDGRLALEALEASAVRSSLGSTVFVLSGLYTSNSWSQSASSGDQYPVLHLLLPQLLEEASSLAAFFHRRDCPNPHGHRS